jgi:hypothetical protein
MTDPIDLLDEAWWLMELVPPLRDSEPIQIRRGRTVGDLRRLLALARDAERLREAVLSVHDDLAERHGESCDCERCLVVQPLADVALEGTDR